MYRLAHRVAVFPLAALAAACAGDPAPLPAPPTAPPPAAAVTGVVPAACTALAADPATPPPEPDRDPRFALKEPPTPGEVCAVADSNLKRAATHILAAPRGSPHELRVVPWDRRAKPARLDDVARRFALSKAERDALAKDGFVVPARLAFPSYAAAFHEIHESEMPLWVSVDAVLHAVFRGSDSVVAELEKTRLAPMLERTLDAMRCALPEIAGSYPQETARDLDVYVTVARSLLTDKDEAPAFEADAPKVAELVKAAKGAAGMTVVSLFGRDRRVDFTQYTPRGHYAGTNTELIPYFRAMMWLTRLELNLVSRSSRSSAATEIADPEETPREAVDAMALADLAARAGVMDNVRALERTFAAFAGKREDVSLDALAELRRKAGVLALTEPRAFERFKVALGDGFQRTTKLHYMPEGSLVLPAITTLLGPRVVADTEATQLLVTPNVASRHFVGAADVGYILGHDRAKAYLAADLARFPDLEPRLAEARARASAPSPGRGEDLYALWYRAVLGLADRPAGATPSFMSTEAFADLRLASAVAAYGQLRHANMLFAGQGYDEGGCEIPDAYVEPAPAVYDALVAYAERGAAAVGAVDPRDEARTKAYFESLAGVLRVLSAISRDELSGRPLGEEARRFLAMVVEMRPGSSAGPPTFTGWYFDMFPTRQDALAEADFIADFFTSGHEGKVAYVGAAAPRLGVFVVDAGGAPRVMVGPVARAYEHVGPLAKRENDASARKLDKLGEPWAASYLLPAPPEPEVTMWFDGDDDTAKAPVARVNAGRALGKVTVEVLDHHRRPLQSLTRDVGKGETRFVFRPAKTGKPIEAVHLAVGGMHAWAKSSWQGATIEMGKKPE
jgi:hypothetical protein